MKKIILSCFASVLTLLTTFTVNSACVIIFGQDKEPESLNRFKKI